MRNAIDNQNEGTTVWLIFEWKLPPVKVHKVFWGERGMRGYLWIWVKPNGTTLTTILSPHFPFLIYLLLTSWGCFQEHPCVVIAALPQNRSLILQGFSSGSCWLYCSPFTDECMLNKLAGYFLIFVIFFSALTWFAFLHQRARSALALLIFPSCAWEKTWVLTSGDFKLRWMKWDALRPAWESRSGLFVGFSSKWWWFQTEAWYQLFWS